jgi:hypothetical protein
MGSGDKRYIVYITRYEHIETEIPWEMFRLTEKGRSKLHNEISD